MRTLSHLPRSAAVAVAVASSLSLALAGSSSATAAVARPARSGRVAVPNAQPKLGGAGSTGKTSGS